MEEKQYYDINLGVLKHIGSGLKILDMGCGTGLLGHEMKKKGNYVYGLDTSKKELSIAKKKLDCVKEMDISSDKIDLPRDFDAIVISDVLEHLKEPASCLKTFKSYLKPNGKVIISVPNVACYNMRLSLLFGQFNYKKYGILDDTHLRFFTFKTAKKMVESAGYRIMKVDTTPYLIRPLFHIYKSLFFRNRGDNEVNANVLNSKLFSTYKDYIFPLENFITKLWPGLLAYQAIIIAKKK